MQEETETEKTSLLCHIFIIGDISIGRGGPPAPPPPPPLLRLCSLRYLYLLTCVKLSFLLNICFFAKSYTLIFSDVTEKLSLIA